MTKTEKAVADRLIEFRWLVRNSEVRDLRAALAEQGAQIKEDAKHFSPPDDQKSEYLDSAFEPLMIVAGAVSISYLAREVFKLIKDGKHSGLIIDAQGDVLEIREHPALDRGTVVVVGKDGKGGLLEPSGATAIVEALF